MQCEPPHDLASDSKLDPTGSGKQRGGSPGSSQPRPEEWIDRLTLPRLLILLTVVSLLLRIFYAGYLFEDDGLWFTAAEQILRGKALYREIYFDKPPVLPLTYALLFKTFGAHILVIRLFTVAFVTAVSAVLYLFGSRLYDRKTGILAASLFAFFSTTGVSGHVQGLNTDFLMVLPYTLGAYLLIQSLRTCRSGGGLLLIRRRACLAIAGGMLTGIAVQTNPKGIFNIGFFAVLLAAASPFYRRGKAGAAPHRLPPRAAMTLLALALAGMFAGSLPFLAHLAGTHSLGDYILYVWKWGFRYARYLPLAQSIATGARVVASYLALNSLLTIALAVFLIQMARRAVRRQDGQGPAQQPGDSSAAPESLPATGAWDASASLRNASVAAPASVAAAVKSRSDVVVGGREPRQEGEPIEPDFVLLIWLACSSAAMAVGGRFYAHYIFELLPALCLVSARGLTCVKHWMDVTPSSRKHSYARRLAAFLLTAGFIVTVVRFHTRTAVLALDWARGYKSESTGRWFHEILNREERMAAGMVSELPGGPEEATTLPPEAIRAFWHSAVQTPGPSDYLFVWGYRPEVYYWSGLVPASRFISIQAVTGVPADVQYINGNSRSVLPDSVKQLAIDQLLRDLEETRPKYIVDEAGMFNSALWITSYPGMADFMRDYKQLEATGRLMIYRRRDPSKKKRLTGLQ